MYVPSLWTSAHLPPHPSLLACYRAPVWAPRVRQQVPLGYLFHIGPTFSFLPTPVSIGLFSVSASPFSSVQFSSVAQSCLTLCDPMNCSTPGLPVHHQLPEFTQIHVYRVSDAILPSHPLSSPSPPAPNPSQHQSLFQWVNSSHEVAKVLEFQL